MDSFTLWINLYSFLYSNIYAFEYKSNTGLKYVLILAIFYSTPRQNLTAHRTFCTFFKYPSGSLSCTKILFIPFVSVSLVCVPCPPFHLLSLYSHTHWPGHPGYLKLATFPLRRAKAVIPPQGKLHSVFGL